MLTRLINNLSLQALITAFLLSYLLIAIAVIGYHSDNYHWQAVFFHYDMPETLLRAAFIGIIPLLAWWFNQELQSLNLLKNHYFLIPIFSLNLCMLSLSGLREDILIALPVLCWLMVRISRLLRTNRPYEDAYDMGMGIGLLSLLIPEFILLLLPLLLALIIFGIFNIRTALIPLVGIFTPWILLFSGLYFFSEQQFWKILGTHFSTIDYSLSPHWDHLWNYLPVATLFVFACVEYISASGHAKIQKRQFLNYSILLFILLVIVGSFLADRQSVYILLAFPLSTMLSNLLQYLKKWWSRDLLFLLLILSLFLVAFRS